MNYKKAYAKLFNAITNAIGKIEKSGLISEELTECITMLKNVQILTEDMYIGGTEPEVICAT